MPKLFTYILVAIAVASIAGLLYVSPSSAGHPDAKRDQVISTPVPIDRQRFWAIIEKTTSFEADTADQAAALKRELEKLPAADVVSFEMTFDTIMRESYSWNLWGADYVVHGGASDDSFEYFRVWLISKGQRFFDTVSHDPDALADMIASDSSGPLEFEDFAYVAREVWASKTGREADDMPMVANMIYPDLKPSGELFQENETYLSKRYPKLWKRFGHNPAA